MTVATTSAAGLLALLLLCGCAGGPGQGRGGGSRTGPVSIVSGWVGEEQLAEPAAILLAGFDRNADAVLDRSELAGGSRQSFAAADRDRSGDLSLIELAGWAGAALGSPSARPGRFDFDRDQSDAVSAAEFEAELGRQFARRDADRDGRLVRRELLDPVRVLRPAGPEQPDAAARGGPAAR